jgi:ribosomal protein S18 acetylase RimI-like enzyme
MDISITRIPYQACERLIAGEAMPDTARKSTAEEFGFGAIRGEQAGTHGFLTFYMRENGEMYIEGICVEPQYRKSGVGTALLRAVEEIACEAGAARLSADVAVANNPSHAFFRKHGFAGKDNYGRGEVIDTSYTRPLGVIASARP